MIAVDVGNNTYSFGRYFETQGHASAVLMSGYLGSIGFGYPAAIGAWAATAGRAADHRGHGRRRLRPVHGRAADGRQARHEHHPRAGQQRPARQDLEGAARRRLGRLADRSCTTRTSPSTRSCAGRSGIRVTEAAQLDEALERALAHDGPAMVEVDRRRGAGLDGTATPSPTRSRHPRGAAPRRRADRRASAQATQRDRADPDAGRLRHAAVRVPGPPARRCASRAPSSWSPRTAGSGVAPLTTLADAAGSSAPSCSSTAFPDDSAPLRDRRRCRREPGRVLRVRRRGARGVHARRSALGDEPSAPILWPEHFDIAFEAGHRERRAARQLRRLAGRRASPRAVPLRRAVAATQTARRVWNATRLRGRRARLRRARRPPTIPTRWPPSSSHGRREALAD